MKALRKCVMTYDIQFNQYVVLYGQQLLSLRMYDCMHVMA